MFGKLKENFHLAANNDGMFFWDRIQFCGLQKAIFTIAVMLVCLPIFASFTVRPWIAMLNGAESAKNCYYQVLGEYWNGMVYLLGIAMIMCMSLGLLKRRKRSMLFSLGDKKWIFSHWLSINLVFLLLWSVVSCFFAKDKYAALWGEYYCHEGLILYFFYGAFFLCGSWLNRKQMHGVAELLTAVGAITAILSVCYDIIPKGTIYLETKQSVMFHHYNHYGYFLSLCAPLSMGLFLQDGKKILWKVLHILEMWLLFNAIAINSVRGSFLAILAVLICFNIYVFTLKKEEIKKIILIDVLFFGTVFFLNTNSRMGSRMLNLVEDFAMVASAENKQAAMDQAGSRRGFLWRNGIQFILKKPIFGYGPGNLAEPYAAVKSHTSSPHNDLLLMGISMGIPAVIFYVSGLLGHLVGLIRYIKDMTILEVTMYAGMGAYLLGSFVGVSIYYTAPYYFLLLGCTYGIYRSRYREEMQAKEAKENA